MLPEKVKKRKLKEKSKTEIKIAKGKIEKKKKKNSKLDVKKKERNGLKSRISSVVEDTAVEMKNELLDNELKSLAKNKKKKSKLGLKLKKSDGNMQLNEIDHDDLDRNNQKQDKEKKTKLGPGKKRRREKEHVVLANNKDQVHVNKQDDNAGGIEKHDHTKRLSRIGTEIKKKKGEKKTTRKKKNVNIAQEIKIEETVDKAGELDVDEISLVDEDCSRGMKKWLTKYKESRPGLNILQQRIDDYISAYEEQREQERKEREAKLEEEGWTVVRQQKGRKKTTDTESGIAVGSVAPAALVDKLSQKKNKEVPLNFYRHQKRDAQRNEVMMLQHKFEQDKKRAQQMKAARKFRPY